MKNILLLLLSLIAISCKQKVTEPNFYKNLYTGEILSKSEFEDFRKEIYSNYGDSVNLPKVKYVYYPKTTSSDSLIQPFKYTIKVGSNYIINASEAKIFEYMNKEFPIIKLATINGDSIQIGGTNEKPTLVNFWHIHCPPCVAEIPVLNKMKEKYSDKVNFISVTFERKDEVEIFLKKNDFNFKHVVEADNYIKEIGSESYPQNIFIDKQGILRNIEGGIPFVNYEKKEIGDGKEFEKIINELL